jgi:hypothetical protein
MKTMLMIALVGMIGTNAMAMSSYESRDMSCSSVHQKVSQDGLAVFEYPSKREDNVMMYSRAVTNSMSCLGQGAMASASVPTTDDPNCKIKTCVPVTGKGSNKNHG